MGGATRISHKVQPEGAFREKQVPRGSYNYRQSAPEGKFRDY